MVVFKDVKRESVLKLLKFGFLKVEVKTVYEDLRLKKNDVSLVFYYSKKLLVQGKREQVEKITKELHQLGIGEETKSKPFRKETGWIIGSDETLKGDTFGGLVVAAVKANKEIREKLTELGVVDSKALRDSEIIVMAEQIKKLVPCEIKSILPNEYNDHKGNVTELLNKLHKKVAQGLLPGKHVVDKYPGCTVGEIIIEKAESKYVEVAAASILARAAGLRQLDYLSLQAGFRVPKGSTHVKLALHELQERNLNFFEFVKIHFNNVKNFLEKK